MSGLRPPQLGPIVGHTTENTCTLWIRAADPNDQGAQLADERRTIGVLAVTEEAGAALQRANVPVFYFRLRREYDRTGVFVLGRDTGILGVKAPSFSLQPDTVYKVRVATLTLDDPWTNDADVQDDELARRLPDASAWRDVLCEENPETRLDPRECEAIFRTFPKAAANSQDFSFLLGSCRYPGILWRGVKHSDQIFGAMESQLTKDDGKGARFVLLVGDQIYGDKFNRFVPVGRAETFEEFQQRYHEAFGSTKIRSLMRKSPQYMILDDHEIEDNWSQDRYDSNRQLFTNAMQAYTSYQWVHGPRNYGTNRYYSFDYAGFPFFVMDTRTQRYMGSKSSPLDKHETLDDNHMLGRPCTTEVSQLSQLLSWLYKQDRNIPKFIVTSSVFVPNPMNVRSGKSPSVKALEESDSWPAFPNTRKAILRCIVENQIQNVVFLSGDIHCSNVAELYFEDKAGKDLGITAFSVTSSALYWPFSFADGEPSEYVHDSRSQEQTDTFEDDNYRMHYKAYNFTQQDNFCRLEVDAKAKTLRVTAHDYKGDLIQEEKPAAGWNPFRPWLGSMQTLAMEALLKLAPW